MRSRARPWFRSPELTALPPSVEAKFAAGMLRSFRRDDECFASAIAAACAGPEQALRVAEALPAHMANVVLERHGIASDVVSFVAPVGIRAGEAVVWVDYGAPAEEKFLPLPAGALDVVNAYYQRLCDFAGIPSDLFNRPIDR
jgi:hypothetical protein